MGTVTREKLIDILVNRRFAEPPTKKFPSPLTSWAEIKARPPYDADPNAAAEALRQLNEAREAWRAELSGKSYEQLSALFKEDLDKEEAQRFFNKPSAAADFEHYGRCARWTLDEAIALSLGKDPNVVHWGNVNSLIQVSAFAKEYAKRRDLVERARKAQQLFEPTPIGNFLHWCKSLGIEVPAQLIKSAVNSGISVKGWQDLYEEQKKAFEQARVNEGQHIKKVASLEAELKAVRVENEAMRHAAADPRGKRGRQKVRENWIDPRTRENLQVIAALCAYRGYGYDASGRSSAIKHIMQDLDIFNIYMSDDMIRDHLKEGIQRFPTNWRLSLQPRSKSRTR